MAPKQGIYIIKIKVYQNLHVWLFSGKLTYNNDEHSRVPAVKAHHIARTPVDRDRRDSCICLQDREGLPREGRLGRRWSLDTCICSRIILRGKKKIEVK